MAVVVRRCTVTAETSGNHFCPMTWKISFGMLADVAPNRLSGGAHPSQRSRIEPIKEGWE
jgi:hypothetical protein